MSESSVEEPMSEAAQNGDSPLSNSLDSAGSDSPLVRGAQNGESLVSNSPGASTEIGLLLDKFRPYLLTIAMAELPDAMRGKVGASDIVQETILKGFENYAGFRGSTTEELAGWLRTILFHTLANCQKAYRSQKRDLALEVSVDNQFVRPDQQTPSELALTREQRSGLEEAMSRMPSTYREAILLRHRENLTFAEIGIRMQKSEDAARKIWTRAIEQLKQELSRSG